MRKLIIFLLLAVYSLGLISAVETNPYQCSFDSICSPAECFSISRQLGEGAFGEVYAVKNSLGETFALKTYKVSEQEYTDNWLGALADAEREFQRGQMLDHAHIVKAYDLFSAKSCIQATNYLVLQLVEGKLYTILRITSSQRKRDWKLLHNYAMLYAMRLRLILCT